MMRQRSHEQLAFAYFFAFKICAFNLQLMRENGYNDRTIQESI